MVLTINGKQTALKKGSSIEYVSENRIFTDADDYSMEIEPPLADCPQNLDIFGMITRKDVDAGEMSQVDNQILLSLWCPGKSKNRVNRLTGKRLTRVMRRGQDSNLR